MITLEKWFFPSRCRNNAHVTMVLDTWYWFYFGIIQFMYIVQSIVWFPMDDIMPDIALINKLLSTCVIANIILCTFLCCQVIHLGWQPLPCFACSWIILQQHIHLTTYLSFSLSCCVKLLSFLNGIELPWNNNVRFAKDGFQESCSILTDQSVLRLQEQQMFL